MSALLKHAVAQIREHDDGHGRITAAALWLVMTVEDEENDAELKRANLIISRYIRWAKREMAINAALDAYIEYWREHNVSVESLRDFPDEVEETGRLLRQMNEWDAGFFYDVYVGSKKWNY